MGKHRGDATSSMISMCGCTGELVAGEICWSNGVIWKADNFLFEVPYHSGQWPAVMEKKLKDKGLSSNAAAAIMIEDKNGMPLSLQVLDDGTPKIVGCAPQEKAFPLTFRRVHCATQQSASIENDGDVNNSEAGEKRTTQVRSANSGGGAMGGANKDFSR